MDKNVLDSQRGPQRSLDMARLNAAWQELDLNRLVEYLVADFELLSEENRQRFEQFQQAYEGLDLITLLHKLLERFNLSQLDAEYAADMDSGAFGKILRGRSQLKREKVDALLLSMCDDGKLSDWMELLAIHRALRIATVIHDEHDQFLEQSLWDAKDDWQMRKQVLDECFWKKLYESYRADRAAYPLSYMLSEKSKEQPPAPARRPIKEQPPAPARRPIKEQPPAPARRPILKALNLAPGVQLELVLIPGGEFIMGSSLLDENLIYDEEPQHTFSLDDYWIGKYPVTERQYRAFQKATRYFKFARLFRYTDALDNHPATFIDYRDALAFCKWASVVTGVELTLPSEAEWEKAARGVDGRIYPWGNEFDKTYCNTFDGAQRYTTPVGMYSPHGDSYYGCADMAGNVWEWTRSIYKPYPYNPKDGREDLSSRDRRVQRGGSFFSDLRYARCAYRYWYNPLIWSYHYVGFRVGVVSPSSLSGL